MKSKWFDLKYKAIKLRQQGSSLREVEKLLKIPKSTLSGWFKNIELTSEQKQRLKNNLLDNLSKARKNAVIWHNQQKEMRLKTAENEAKNVLSIIDMGDKSILELTLAILYLGEGAKSDHTCIGSSDPLILKFFIKGLIKVYGFDVKRIVSMQEVMMITKKGQAIRFNSDEVRDMGRASYGVTGIKLDDDDAVVSIEIVEDKNASILTITEKGYGKRSSIEDYRLTGRAGKGVINLKVNEKTGDVVSSITVGEKDTFVVSTIKGIVIRTRVRDIRVMGRATSGVRIIKLDSGDSVSDIARLDTDEDVTDPESLAAYS